MTTDATDRPELHALLAVIRDRLEVIAPDVPHDLRELLTGTVGTLKRGAPAQLGAILLELYLEIHGIVEALLYRSLPQIEADRAVTIGIARRIERIGTAARWAYVVIAAGDLRVGVEPAEQVARAARDELHLGEPVEDTAERMAREMGEEQRANAAALIASGTATRGVLEWPMIGWLRVWDYLDKHHPGRGWDYLDTDEGRHIFERGAHHETKVARVPVLAGDWDSLIGARFVHVADPTTPREVLSANQVTDVATLSPGPAVGWATTESHIPAAILLDSTSGWTRVTS